MAFLRAKLLATCDIRSSLLDEVIEQALLLEKEGADIIHIGLGDEKFVLKLLKALKDVLRVPISVDIGDEAMACRVLSLGVGQITDLSGFKDPAIRKLVAKSDVDVCIVYRQPHFFTARHGSFHEAGIVADSVDWLDKQSQLLLHDGVESHRIIIDPDVGFGKSPEENFEILHHIQKFRALGFRVAVGTYCNHKSSADIAVSTFLALSHVDIIRVDTVQSHRKAFNLLYAIIGRDGKYNF